MALSRGEQFKDGLMEVKHGVDIPNRLFKEPIFTVLANIESFYNKTPVEEIRKRKFLEIITDLQKEATPDASNFGIIEYSSRAFQEFITAIHVIFTPEQIRKFKEDARPRFGIFRTIIGPGKLSKKELKDSEDFFQNKFKAYSQKPDTPEKDKKTKPEKEQTHTPKSATLAEHALASRNMRLVLKRLLSEADLAPRSSRGDLRSILRRHPEIGADIGMILLTKGLLDHTEKAQERQSNGRRVFDGMARSIQKDLCALHEKDLHGVLDQIEWTKDLSKKNYFWGPVSIFLLPLRLIPPILRTFFSIPKSFAIGARDAFVFTGYGNKRPQP